jgi:molecular chaperone IbpB/HSP20 family protein
MKDKIVIDIGRIMDEVFNTAQEFGESFKKEFHERGDKHPFWDETVDFYPTYSYPPANVYMTKDKTLVFEFALAGFKEEEISIEFSGDHMLFSAKPGEEFKPPEDAKYFKRRFKVKEIEEQRYYVPTDKFNHEETKAVFKSGVLRVSVPPKEEVKTEEGFKVEIVAEDEE